MRFLFLLFILPSIICHAQREVISPLQSNASIYYQQTQTKQLQSPSRSYLIEKKNILINTDTLELPFTDDFSTNTLRGFDFYKNNFFDTIYYAYGPCDSVLGIFETEGRFHTVQSYDFFWNTSTKSIDSTPTTPVVFTRFPGLGLDCIELPAGTWNLWPETIRKNFDTLGNLTRQYLDTFYADTLIKFAPDIFRARLSLGTKWTDNYAYWNTHMPILPPTIGVATLDGLNEFGLPYNKLSPTIKSVADYLTSKPINLSGLSVADSVYLSFYYQPQGLGDWPNRSDSLILEFYNNFTSKWDRMWSVRGDTTSSNSPRPFTQVMVLVPQTQIPIRDYFYNGFQFRFKNIASLAGNNDHWHIDYVRFNKNRNLADTIISDIAFVYPIPSLFKDYEVLASSQYEGSSSLIDTLKIKIRNNNFDQAIINPPATQSDFRIDIVYQNPSVVFVTQNTFNAGPISEILLFPKNNFSVPISAGDSLVITAQASLNVPNINQTNDTVLSRYVCEKVLAYDDGSAERSYGLEGLGLKKFAQEFILNNPDTLVGFQVHFSNIDVKVEDLIFTFNIWDTLELNRPAFRDSAIYTSDNKKPYYIDSVNGYATFLLDTPMRVSNKYYLGWSQTDTRNLQIGYDLNSTKGREHMLIFTNGTWKKSTTSVNGSVMIRSLLKRFDGFATALDIVSKNLNLELYPNPATNSINLRADIGIAIELFSIDEKKLMNFITEEENSLINISNLSNGIYFLKATDNNKSQKTLKFVKSH
jgi:hypothetical protein